MSAFSTAGRRLLVIAAAIVGTVAFVVAIAVVPPVRGGGVPNITSGRAVPAFWVAVGLHLLAAAVLLLVMAFSQRRSALSTSVLVVTAVAILLFGVALGDAAKAPLEIGAPMQAVSVLLFGCLAADVVASALAFTAALGRPGRA